VSGILTNREFGEIRLNHHLEKLVAAPVSALALCSVCNMRLTSACEITIGPFGF
jgi:hypothetical protein